MSLQTQSQNVRHIFRVPPRVDLVMGQPLSHGGEQARWNRRVMQGLLGTAEGLAEPRKRRPGPGNTHRCSGTGSRVG